MANQAAKKAARNAEKVSDQMYIPLLVLNAVYFVYRVVWHYSSFSNWHVFAYLVILFLTRFCYGSIISAASSNTGSEYYFDVLAIAVTVQTLSMFSEYAFFIFLVIPGYLGYLLIRRLLNWVFTPDPVVSESQQSAIDAQAAKRARRAEHKKKKEALYGVRMGGGGN